MLLRQGGCKVYVRLDNRDEFDGRSGGFELAPDAHVIASKRSRADDGYACFG